MKDVIRVSAVVVTYNRCKMLADSLRALISQTRAPDEILVIDNASTDETPSLFGPGAEFNLPYIQCIRLAQNSGGAGGFKEGMKRSVEGGSDWCWVMDDDVVPEPNALEGLLDARTYLSAKGIMPSYLASCVYGPHGEVMNVPNVSKHVSQNGYADWCEHLPHGLVRIGSATFVSLLISVAAIREVGLPISDYFLWGDDAEYTTRLISYYGPAFVCGASCVAHMRTASRAISTAEETDTQRVENRRRAIRNELINTSYYDGAAKTVRRVVRRAIECGHILLHANILKREKVRAICGGVSDFVMRRYDLEDLARLDKKNMRRY